MEIDNVTFSFLIYLIKAWSENSISIPIHPGIIYFWIWLFGGAAYEGGKREREGGGTDEEPVSDKPPLIRCGETYVVPDSYN